MRAAVTSIADPTPTIVSLTENRVRWEAPIARRLMPERLTTAEGEIGVLRLGAPDRTPLLFVHGFSGDFLTWQYNLPAFARDHHVVALDLPGHGLSSPPTGPQHWRDTVDWLVRALATLGLDNPHIVGHSLGGRLALGLAENGLAAVRSLTLISCAGIGPNHDYPLLKRLASIETLEEAQECSRYLFGEAIPDLDRFARALHAKSAQPHVRAGLTAILDANFQDGELISPVGVDWARVDCPVQMIWARDDRVAEVPAAEHLPPNVPVHLLEMGGHMPHIAAADRVNRLIAAFLHPPQTPQVSKVAPQE
jgi:pimeloyl-ACP methyl ester carboxylesterase